MLGLKRTFNYVKGTAETVIPHDGDEHSKKKKKKKGWWIKLYFRAKEIILTFICVAHYLEYTLELVVQTAT